MNDDYSFLTEPGISNSRRRFMDRRGFIKNTGSLVALGSLPAYLTANADELQSSLEGIQQHEGIVLYREHEAHSVAFAGILSKAGLTAVALSDDPVRQWRDGLGRDAARTGLPVTGLTNWADYLMISGLAAEQRKHPVLEMQHSVNQAGKEHWPAQMAIGFLHLPVASGRETIRGVVEEYLAGQRAIKPGEPTLFSWVIA